jgi:hypothetical protein
VPRLSHVAGALLRIPRALSLIRRHGRPGAIFYFGESPGDDLLATAVARHWREVRGSRAAYLTRYPELFAGNTDIAFTAPFDPLLAGAFQALGVPRHRLQYHVYDPTTDRSLAPRDTHIINLMCRSAGLPPIASPVPIVHLADAEIARPVRRSIVLQSSVLSAKMPIRNKEWFPDRMQAVADALGSDAEIVHLGVASDPPLAGVTDLRGRTTIREAAGILGGASLFIGMVGFLMHLARAVGTPSVVIFGGREHPDQSGYPQNQNLFTALPCSPCWLWNQCPYERECLRRIDAGDVIAAARRLLE